MNLAISLSFNLEFLQESIWHAGINSFLTALHWTCHDKLVNPNNCKSTNIASPITTNTVDKILPQLILLEELLLLASPGLADKKTLRGDLCTQIIARLPESMLVNNEYLKHLHKKACVYKVINTVKVAVL